MMGLGKGNSLFTWQFLVSMLDFWGVSDPLKGYISDLQLGDKVWSRLESHLNHLGGMILTTFPKSTA